MTPKKSFRAIPRFIFTVSVLKNSSVTGQLSNVEKSKDPDAKLKPAVNEQLLRCVKNITHFWMIQTGKDEVTIRSILGNIGCLISKQISDLNRIRKTTSNKAQAKIKSKRILSSDNDSSGEENYGDEDKDLEESRKDVKEDSVSEESKKNCSESKEENNKNWSARKKITKTVTAEKIMRRKTVTAKRIVTLKKMKRRLMNMVM
ncbi:uncharacterized protein LOC117182163 [Belonocnema kinseyi]|uniref:uncharacterized protein LOC117182163 n=1 Tax=Belonocnema kinseyi TaxID=2817044 RepID=UPI00143D010A|nr:uncharacterized protein LOC117182163 [Belonocnema kinseyi]